MFWYQDSFKHIIAAREQLKRVQRNLKIQMRDCKDKYRRTMKAQLQLNNAMEVLRGLRVWAN